jgi:carbamate kinase
MARSAVIAVGGNALIRAGERGTIDEQVANARRTARNIARLIESGWRVVVTHGNGPQVGAALLRSERAAREVYSLPLDVCVSTTQGEIGYLLQQALSGELKRVGVFSPVATVLTRVQVRADDPAFKSPTKPVGPFYSRQSAEEKQALYGWAVVEDSARGFRRVVPSPDPVAVLDHEVIREMLEVGVTVIALGGGGIPVVVGDRHSFVGIEAVIDKDRASALLATELGVDSLIISTDVDCVYLDYRKPTQRALERESVQEMEKWLKEGQFPAGSMGPKVESAITFLRSGGKEVIIASCENLVEAVEGKAGTHIVPSTASVLA